MSDTSRRENDERFADWVDGRMSERERERFVAEMRVNTQLQRDLEQYERTVGTVRAALRAPTASSPMADRVLAALASGRAAPAIARERAGWTLRHAWWSIASAAALLACAWWIDSWSQSEPARTPLAAVESREPARDEFYLQTEPPADPAADAPERRHAYAVAPDATIKESAPAAAAPTLKSAPGGEGADKRGESASKRADGVNKDAEAENKKADEKVAEEKKLEEKRMSAAQEQRWGDLTPGAPTAGNLPPRQAEMLDAYRKAAGPGGTRGPGDTVPTTGPGAALGGGGTAQPAGPATGGPGTFRGQTSPGTKPGESGGKPAAGDDATLRLRLGGEPPPPPAAKAAATPAPAPEADAGAAARSAAPQPAPVAPAKAAENEASKEGLAKRGELLALVVLEGEVAPAPARHQAAGLAARSADERERNKDDRKPAEKSEPKSRGAAPGNPEARREVEAPLDAAALRQRIDQFLAAAADTTVEPSALRWVTKTGAVDVSPWLGEALELAEMADKGRPERAADLDTAKGTDKQKTDAKEEKAKLEDRDREGLDRDKNSVAPIERTWLVEGSKEDVEVLLLRLRAFRDAQHLTMRTGEVAAPKEGWREDRAGKDGESPAASTDSLAYGRFARAPAAERTRIVLRLRLRAR